MADLSAAVAVPLAAVLLYSGTAKVVSPSGLATALGELLRLSRPPGLVVRLIAVGETAIALLLVIWPGALGTRLVVAGAGLAFALAGLAGYLRRTTQPCGCFGVAGSRALGWWNVVFGCAFVGWAVLPAAPVNAPLANVVLGLTGSLVIPLVVNRRYLKMLAVRQPGRRPT
jgi:hypothetical protein